MIILYHQNNVVVSLWNNTKDQPIEMAAISIVETMFALAKMFPSDMIVWCHISQKEYLNLECVTTIFHHQKIMASYHPMNSYLSDGIGYVEDSPFIKINKEVQFATWQMSSLVGGISSQALHASELVLPKYKNFDYFLVSLAKRMMPLGLLCYSAPLLLNGYNTTNKKKYGSIDSFGLFRFVKQHYKCRWVFLLFLNYIFYERRFKFFPLLVSLFYKRLKGNDKVLDGIAIHSSKKSTGDKTVDVIIPTIGRKKYLYDVLCDFRAQTHLPSKIIIVEQNPLENSESELDYLHKEEWPFEIMHTFTHKAGACNARNIALSQTSSNWVFLADDDIRIAEDFLKKAYEGIEIMQNKAFTFSCLREQERAVYIRKFQWTTFGSGCSLVAKEAIKEIQFDNRYEFGFGEDADLGMQLRNKGYDVLYLPNPEILHLKAVIGGFRTKPRLEWHDDPVQPKPSPTVMLFKLMYDSHTQLLGYKTVLFFKFYGHQSIRKPFAYYKKFQQQWERSVYWAQKISK